MAVLMGTNGDRQEVTTADGGTFTLPALQKLVGGYIETVRTGNGLILVINENGKNEGMPRNEAATMLARRFIGPGDYIAGPALLVEVDELDAVEDDREEDTSDDE